MLQDCGVLRVTLRVVPYADRGCPVSLVFVGHCFVIGSSAMDRVRWACEMA